jgi:phage virion morphogenesis protein
MTDPIFSLKYQDQAVSDRLKRILEKTGDLKPAFKEIGEYGLAVTESHFENEQDPEGRPWKPNAPHIVAQKIARGRINKVLQDTGLMRSQTSYQVTDDKVTIGNNSPYAYKHQLGIGVAKRPFLGFSSKNLQVIAEILDDYLTST